MTNQTILAGKETPPTYVPRFLEPKLRKLLGRKEILAVVGPRQSGKTTLLRHIFQELENAVFLDFEDRETLQLFTEDIKLFVELYVKKYNYIFIDEFQYAKNGGKNLKFIYDHYPIKIIISGSSVSGLSIQSLQFLVGRVLVFSLYPFSFEEFLSYKKLELYSYYLKNPLTPAMTELILPLFQEFCLFGGYPSIVLASDYEEKEVLLKNIHNTYLLKEIKEILNIPEDYKLSRLIQALALQIGNMLNYQELSSLTGFSHPDLLKYLNILEKTFIVTRSYTYHTNKRTELVKTPKIFFVDNGFRNIVLKNFQPLKERPDKGSIYENFVASELAKQEIEIKYWRTKSKAEVDFVVESNGKVIPIEVKSDLNEPKITKSFHSFLEKYKPSEGIIFSEKLISKWENISFAPIFSVNKEVKKLI